MLKKLKSRKLWLAILGVMSGAGTALTGLGGTTGVVAGVIVAGASAVTYIITEGKIDAAGVTLTVDAVKKIIELITEAKSTEVKNE